MKFPCLARTTTLTALFSVAACSALRADVAPAPLFCAHAVLQQGKPVPVWGTAEPGEAVSVAYVGQQRDTTADAQGNWMVRLDPLRAGQAGTLAIQGKNALSFDDVVAGEVWLCSGQSNMQLTVKDAKDAAREIAEADHPQVRQFYVPEKGSARPEPAGFVKSGWQPCAPQAVRDFTAVGYFFARDLSQALGGVPVGIIDSSWGGTPIATWMSQPSLDAGDPAAPAGAGGRTPPGKPGSPDAPVAFQNMPAGLFNGMIHPLLPYAIRGALWYQGETDAEKGPAGAARYARLLPLLVKGWREAWGEGDFPFYFVQLPNWDLTAKRDASGESWAFFREAQAKSVSAQPDVAMAVAIDVGETGDVHPKNKQAVGHRLALIAEARDYGLSVEWAAPSFHSMQVEEGGRVRVNFDHVGDGLSVHGDLLKGFTVAGEDLKFVPAEARVEGGSVVVSSPQVSTPVAVRYAWGNDPAGCNLYNQAGLPAAPFRSDEAAK